MPSRGEYFSQSYAISFRTLHTFSPVVSVWCRHSRLEGSNLLVPRNVPRVDGRVGQIEHHAIQPVPIVELGLGLRGPDQLLVLAQISQSEVLSAVATP